jgi:tetratricopeptide (TPR) repeat protein
MKKASEQRIKDIANEVKKYSLEKQISISNNIIKNTNNAIDHNMSEALASFSSMINDLGSLDNKRVLLLQPEKYMTLAIFLCLNGAAIVYGLNRFVQSEERLSTYYEKLLAFILKNKKDIIVRQELSDDEIISKFNEIVSLDKKKMRSYLNRDKARFSLGEDASLMPYQDGLFDLVISDHVFETLYYPFQSLNEIKRVMAKDANLYMRISPNGSDITKSSELAARLKLPRELFEKSFSYKSVNYCNRIQKSELLFHLNNFNFNVDSVSDKSNVKISDFDKKDINPYFILSGSDDSSTYSFVIMAHKRDVKKDSFSPEDYKTYAKGLDLYNKGKYNAACARFESLRSQLQETTKKAAVDDRVYHGLFNILHSLKDYENAIAAFRQVKKVKMKSNVKDYYYYADSYFKLGDYKNAKKYFLAAEELNPKQYLAINSIGLCEYKLGDVEEALKTIKRAIKIFPYFSEGLGNIGMILEATNKRKAIEHFKVVLTIDPGHSQALFSMGRLLYDEGYYEDAAKYLKEYCIIDGKEESALKMHIDCLIKLGLKKTAKKEMENILEKDPGNTFISTMFEEFMTDSMES